MKTSRVITLVLVAVTTLLCCFPVAALDVANSYSYSNVIDNSLTQYLNVSVMYADDESYSYCTDSDVVQYYDAPTYQALVNYRVKNTSDQDANLNVSYIALDFGLQASGYNVIGVEYVSGALEPYYVSISDFRLQQVDGTSTTVIVPAGGYISGTFIIHLQKTYDNSSGTHIEYPAFSNFNTWDTFSPTYGNYNSTVIDYVSDVYSEMLEQGVTLDSIYSILNTTHSVQSLTFSGNALGGFNRSNNSTTDNIYRTTQAHFLPAFVKSIDDEYTSSENITRYIVDVPVWYYFNITNRNDTNYIYTSNTVFGSIANISLSSSYDSLGYYDSDFLGNGLVLQSNALGYIYYFVSEDNTQVIAGKPYSYSFIRHYLFSVDVNNTGTATFDYTFSSQVSAISGTFVPVDNDIVDIVEEQHDQEQTYYSDTNTALQNSGLPDYNFNSQQTGGLSGVSDDFVRVWNACGALNSVFVFSLTLSLALYILRHRRRL